MPKPGKQSPDRSAKRRAELVAALLRPEAYPHPVDTPIEVVETHISHLFLTGRYVYKIKKPVDLGFLDFTTLEKRRRYTCVELKLNRCMSPDVYLGVVEVGRGAEGRLLVGADDVASRDEDCESGGEVRQGEREVEEYALKMRQLDARHALRHLVQTGKVENSDVESLGRRLAGFHDRSAPAGPRSPYGGPALVRRLMTDNLDAVGPWAAPLSISEHVRRVAAYTTGATDAFAPLIAARKAEGRVRDCHGDLHAENIFLEPAPQRRRVAFQIIDRLEFNDRYRFIDVASDLAFLTMDLKHLGRPDLAGALVTSYRSVADDPGLETMLPFYEVYRAMVRCKVAVLRVAEQAGGRPRRLREEPAEAGAARQYATLAARMVVAQRPRAMFVMTGVAGSGKSTVARDLANRWGIRYESSDVIRKTLFGLDPHRPSDPSVRDELYSPRMSARTYGELVRRGGEELAAGRSVLLDAAFLKRDHRNRARAVATRHGMRFVVIECRIDRRKARARLKRRYESGASESDAGPELLDYHISERESVSASECDAHITVDTGGDPERCVDLAEADIWRQLLQREASG